MFSFKTSVSRLKVEDNLIYYSLLLFGALLPFQFALNPATGFDLAIVRIIIPIVFLGWIIFSMRNKNEKSKNDKMTYLLPGFLALAILSLSFSHNILWSLRKLLFLFSIVPVYFIALSALSTETRRRKMAIALVLGAAALSIVALVQFSAQFVFGIDPVYAFLANHISPFFLGKSFSQTVLTYPSWLVNAGGTTYMRATAVFPDPHMLSYYLGMLLPWSIALWGTSKKHVGLFFFSSAILLAADIFTFTRGGYLALIAGSLIVLPLIPRTAIKKVFAIILILACLLVLAPHSPVAGRFASSFDIQEGSNQGRISNWKEALLIIRNSPLGVGIGMYSLAVNPGADYREPIYAHNLYLDLAAELGIQAALIFMAILFFTLTNFWRAAKKNPLMIAGVSSMTIFAVHSLVETPLYSVHVLTLFCIILAIGASFKYHEEI